MKIQFTAPSILAGVLTSFLAITIQVRAQAPELPPLEAIRAPKNSAWTVTYNYADETQQAEGKAAVPGRIKILSVQKEQDVYHELKAFVDGKKTKPGSKERLTKIKNRFKSFIEEKILKRDKKPAYYIYKQIKKYIWTISDNKRKYKIFKTCFKP